MDRIAPSARPPGRAQGSQRWHKLLFAHWEIPEEILRPLVPRPLELDGFEGRYYAGVVSFLMQNVRPCHSAPSIPTATTFGEINLRTYVHLDGREPGVYFFSLDAASTLAVWAARTFWDLPYYRADVTARYTESEVEYRSRRRRAGVESSALARLAEPLPESTPGSLQFFLCERYQFYAPGRGGLRRARVHHAPYQLFSVRDGTTSSALLEAARLPITGARTPDFYSPGVDVEVFPLTPVVT